MLNARITKNKFFVFCFLALYALSLLLLFSRRGVGFYLHPFAGDSFMDLFNMAVRPYNTTYPPLSLIPFKLLHLLPHPDVALSEEGLRANYCGAMFLALYFLAFASVFLFTTYFFVKGEPKRKIFYSVLLLFSGIVLWALERANIMSFAFLLSLLFVIFYSSGDDKKKRLSYLFIALAMSLKLYPGAFLLLLLEKKDFKGLLTVALETLVIFVFSFIACAHLDFIINFEKSMGLMNYMKSALAFVKVAAHLALFALLAAAACFLLFQIHAENWKRAGIAGAACLAAFFAAALYLRVAKGVDALAWLSVAAESVLNALKFGDRMTKNAEGVNVSIKNFVLLAHFFLTGKASVQSGAAIALCKILCAALCVFSFAFNKKIWKKLLSVSLLCVYVPDFSGMYLLLYLLIPLLHFINDGEESALDFAFACLFAVATTFLIVPHKFVLSAYYLVTGSFVVISLSVFAMFLLVVLSAAFDLIKERRQAR